MSPDPLSAPTRNYSERARAGSGEPVGAHAVPVGDVGPSDLSLVERTRSGDSRAYAELYNRHARAGRTVARSYSSDADDIVAESFAKVLQAIKNGGGPTTAFRPYLFSTIRNVAMQWKRNNIVDASDELDARPDPRSEEAETLLALDKSLTAQAFRSLPTRWQEALWYSEVEQLSSQEISPLLGMTPNAVSALTFRAREGLRQAWIQAHLVRAADTDCASVIEKLGSYTRGSLGPRETRKIREHLAACTSCAIVNDEARAVGARLALVLLPLVAGIAGATAYTVALQSAASAHAAALAPAVAPAAAHSAAAASAHAAASAPAAAAHSTAAASAHAAATAPAAAAHAAVAHTAAAHSAAAASAHAAATGLPAASAAHGAAIGSAQPVAAAAHAASTGHAAAVSAPQAAAPSATHALGGHSVATAHTVGAHAAETAHAMSGHTAATAHAAGGHAVAVGPHVAAGHSAAHPVSAGGQAAAHPVSAVGHSGGAGSHAVVPAINAAPDAATASGMAAVPGSHGAAAAQGASSFRFFSGLRAHPIGGGGVRSTDRGAGASQRVAAGGRRGAGAGTKARMRVLGFDVGPRGAAVGSIVLAAAAAVGVAFLLGPMMGGPASTQLADPARSASGQAVTDAHGASGSMSVLDPGRVRASGAAGAGGAANAGIPGGSNAGGGTSGGSGSAAGSSAAGGGAATGVGVRSGAGGATGTYDAAGSGGSAAGSGGGSGAAGAAADAPASETTPPGGTGTGPIAGPTSTPDPTPGQTTTGQTTTDPTPPATPTGTPPTTPPADPVPPTSDPGSSGVPTPSGSFTVDPSERLYPVVSGSALPGATVDVVELSSDGPVVVASTVADRESGAFTVSDFSDLGAGTHRLAVRQTSAAGGRSAPGAETLVSLRAPAISEPQPGQTLAPTGYLLTVHGIARSFVEVVLDRQRPFDLHQLDSEGILSIEQPLPPEATPGTTTLAVRYIDPDTGRTGPLTSVSVTLPA